jgi:hypothetical protein
MDDYDYFKELLKNSKCYLCNEGFTKKNKPTLDRKNNRIGYTKANVYPCCCYCNRVKSNRCKNDTKLFIQLKKYATKMNLPFTFAEGDEEEYEITRKNITGGLLNVHNRKI